MCGTGAPRVRCPRRRRSAARAPTHSWLRSAASRSSTSRSPTGTWSTSRSRSRPRSRLTAISSLPPTCTPMHSPWSRTCWASRPSPAATRRTSPSGTRRPRPRRRRCTRQFSSPSSGMHRVPTPPFSPTSWPRRSRRRPAARSGPGRACLRRQVHVGAHVGSTRATRPRPTARQAREIQEPGLRRPIS